jgi:colanic acid biosynthesis glycosyl transferase WcaI
LSRLLIVSLNYAPEPTGFAPHTAALAEHLGQQGHDVTVITGFPYAPRWCRWPDYRGQFIRQAWQSGVRVIRVTHFIPRRPGSAIERVLMEGSFAAIGLVVFAVRRFGQRERYDGVIYVGAQPALAWLARIVSTLHRAAFVVKITDLAAQAAVDVGIVKNRALAWALDTTEFAGYRGASAAVVLCDSFRDVLVAHGWRADDVEVIPDSVDLEKVRPGSNGSRFRERYGLPSNAFIVLYSGSFGLKQNLLDVVATAGLLKESHPSVRWALVGDGESRAALERAIAAASLEEQVFMVPLQPEEAMSEMFAAADALLLSQLRSVKDTVIPSKLLTYMASGRAVIAAVNPQSQAAGFVRDADGGLVVEPENAAALAAAVLRLLSSEQERTAMGARNRMYAERRFDRSRIVRAQQALIERVVMPRPALNQ